MIGQECVDNDDNGGDDDDNDDGEMHEVTLKITNCVHKKNTNLIQVMLSCVMLVTYNYHV